MLVRSFLPVALVFPLVGAIQPQARDSDPNQQIRHLEWGDLNFLHTTDNHGWHAGHLQEPQYSADLGDYMSFISHMRRMADEKGVDLLVVDSGDRSEGNGLYDASDPMGKYTRRILRKANHFDLLTSGNHELYNGTTSLNEWREMVPHFGDRYLSSNIEINATGEWEPFATRNLKFKTKKLGLTISAFGFLFDFTGNDVNTRVTPASQIVQQEWFRKAISDTEVDVFLILCHIDVDFLELKFIHGAIRALHPEVPIQFMAGHAHQRKFRVFDDKCSALESGRYCETVGFLSLSGLVPKDENAPRPRDGGKMKTFRRYIDYNRVNFQHHSNTTQETFDTEEGLSLSREMTGYREKLDLNRLIGCAPQDYTLDKSPYPSKNNWYSYLATTLLPKMVFNPVRNTTPHMIFINGGSQRFDVFKGPFTYDTSFLISPFTSRFLFARDIPYPIASRLLDYFLRDPSPYAIGKGSEEPRKRSKDIMTTMGETPPWDPNYDYADVLLGHVSSAAKWRSRQQQKPSTLHNHNQQILSPFQFPIPDYEYTANTPSHYHRTLGYTTIDDHGTTGDDTVHLPFTKYPAPKVLQSNVGFTPTSFTPATVDIVFFDFIAKNVEAGLNTIAEELEMGKRWERKEFERYMGQERTLTRLILDFVGMEWGRECV